mgnify:CR=1 FL=1
MEKECICEQLTNVLPLDCKMECVHADRNLFYSYPEEKAEIRAAKKIHIEEITKQLRRSRAFICDENRKTRIIFNYVRCAGGQM